MVMEASGKDDDHKRRFYAQMAEKLLMDTVEVDVELQRTRIGPHTFQKRTRDNSWYIRGFYHS